MKAAYSRTELKPRILHFGLGAFFRAHLADYTDTANRLSSEKWGIRAVKTRPGGDVLTNAIQANGGVYTLVETSSTGAQVKVISSLYDTLFYCDNPAAIFETFCDPDFAIVTTTITEKGYCFDFGKNQLDESNGDIIYDCAHPEQPRSVPGIIVRGLSLRKQTGLGGITLLSCDNMTNNGHTFKKAICDLARLQDGNLADWIERKVSFPSAMVDRIVPAMTSINFQEAGLITGYADKAAIVCEQFKQWVVEDDFRNGRPDWDKAGAIFTTRVEPFEEMKLRLLNGSHSSLAYCGYLCGYETVDEAINNDKLHKLIIRYWNSEAIPTLEQPPGISLTEYCAKLIERYRNPALKHRLWQIAMDGSQKLPYRLLNGLRINIAAGRDFSVTGLVLAAWLRYVSAVDDNGMIIDVRDPLALEFRAAYDSEGSAANYVRKVFEQKRIFGEDLSENEQLIKIVNGYYEQMKKYGTKAVLEMFLK